MLTFPPKHVNVHCRKCYILASLKDASRLDCPYDLFFFLYKIFGLMSFSILSVSLSQPPSLPLFCLSPSLLYSFISFLSLLLYTHTHTHARTHARTHAFSKGNFNECIARAKRARISKTLYIFYIDEIGITI